MIPDVKKFEENGVVISTPFQGFMAACCPYQVKERKLLILEKDYGLINTEGPINFETIKIYSNDRGIELTYSTYFDKELIKKKKIKR